MARKIIHVDMDAFYASVEQRDQPHLRGKPVAVAGGGENKRSVVLTASYEARLFGVRSAMPLYQAQQRCPELLVTPPRHQAYREVSAQIREIFTSFTPLVEPLSLDEAYLDVTHPLRGGPSATLIAQAIRAQIREQTGLSATAGVSVNRFLAKLASGLNKPDGLTVILPQQAQAILDPLPVAEFHGIGPATVARLAQMGIHTGADLRAASVMTLVQRFGQVGEHFWRIAHGQDDRPVNPNRPHKSIGAEETYATDLHGVEALQRKLPDIALNVEKRLLRAGMAGKTVIVKVKFSDWSVVTRRMTTLHAVQDAGTITQLATPLLAPELLRGRGVRLLGITITNLLLIEQLPRGLFDSEQSG